MGLFLSFKINVKKKKKNFFSHVKAKQTTFVSNIANIISNMD